MQVTEAVADQAAGLRHSMKPQPVQVMAVTSGKGGVGKTNVSVNLAVAMARAGHQVMLMDADLGLANADMLFDVRTKYNLAHVLSGERTLEEVLVETESGVRLVPADSGNQDLSMLGTAESAGFIRAFSELSFPLDRMIIDTSAGITDSVVSFIKASHHVIIVVCDEPASITDAYAMIKVLSQNHGLDHFQVLANMTRSTQHGHDLFGKLSKVTDRFLDVTLTFLGAIPFDEYLQKAVQKRKPVVECFPRSRSSQAFQKIVQKTDRWPIPEVAGGHLQFFVERLIRYSADSGGPYQ